MKSVFVNLMDNAIKYSQTHSVISINMEIADAEMIAITSEDHGAGIAQEELAKIFKRFYRSNKFRSQVRGSGLGLAIALEFVAMHKGDISVAVS